MIRVLLVDDHVLMRQGTRTLLEEDPGIVIVGEAAQGEEALLLAAELRPDVVLLDIRLIGLNGVEVARKLRGELPEIKVLMLTAYPYEQYVRALFAIGVHGYLLKNATAAELIAGVRAVHRGESVLSAEIAAQQLSRTRTTSVVTTGTLSEREHAILRLVSQGATNREIGAALAIREHTVESHIGNTMIKLSARSRVEAVTLAIQRGVLVLDE